MNKVWRTVLLVAMVCFAFGATAIGASAKPSGNSGKPSGKPSKSGAGSPGQLDPTFGEGGKVAIAFPAENAGTTGPKYELPFTFTPGHLEMASAPGGKTVVAGATKVVRYLADGKLDPGFGDGGSISVPRPPGAIFVLAGVAVDSHGRIVLAGLARPLPSNSAPDPVLSSAVVMRFAANGAPDTGFGNGGMVVGDLGLGAPKAGSGFYPGASVGLRDVVIDAQDRPVLSGGYVTELIGSGEDGAVSKGFVARLTETGALDPSFGEGGVRTLANVAAFGQLAPRASGYLTLATGTERPKDLLGGFDENGNLDTNFGSFGFRPLTSFADAPTLAVAPSGKILLLGQPEKRRGYRTVKEKDKETGKVVSRKVQIQIKFQPLQRLLPSGTTDPGFDRTGTNDYVDPKSGSFAALAVDSQERIYLAGRISKRVSKSAKNTLKRSSFTLTRAEPSGSIDRSFGQKGTVTTGFGGPTSTFATQVMLDAKGRILVGGGIISPQLETGGGFAIARYLPGS